MAFTLDSISGVAGRLLGAGAAAQVGSAAKTEPVVLGATVLAIVNLVAGWLPPPWRTLVPTLAALVLGSAVRDVVKPVDPPKPAPPRH